MPGGVLPDHLDTLPTARFFQDHQRSTCLDVPRRPGMAKVVKMEVLDADGAACPFEHACVDLADPGDIPACASRTCEDQTIVNSAPAFQDGQGVSIERNRTCALGLGPSGGYAPCRPASRSGTVSRLHACQWPRQIEPPP